MIDNKNFICEYLLGGDKRDLETFVKQISELNNNTVASIVQHILFKTTDVIFCQGIFNTPKLVQHSDNTYYVTFDIISNFNVATFKSFEKLMDELKVRYEINIEHVICRDLD